MDAVKIQRINELSRKSKVGSLTPQERDEQQQLRQEYISAFKGNLKATLDSIVLCDKEGNTKKLRKN
ncbi:uncharacterized protein YnzC (UPF0291/DUF896 family) [Anaerobacterium chartisolvens]|uniref:UPF0291 protein DFR58_10274 n=1 Tax=Anaerobacterium chartisolvens TaxID=1297424 RepID=A0A369BFF6_9FIRM|nr:DUF896 domain-containing protein [Anaerobacterium chartisolvens]RCX20005.1 uncharacterized protein YnzC (UPF0291/DUF896 family) [Anaerobacterium chartisolvens]